MKPFSAAPTRQVSSLIFRFLVLMTASAYVYGSQAESTHNFEDSSRYLAPAVDISDEQPNSLVAAPSLSVYAETESSPDTGLGQVISAEPEDIQTDLLSGTAGQTDSGYNAGNTERNISQPSSSSNAFDTSRMGVFIRPQPDLSAEESSLTQLYDRPLCRTADDTRGVCHQRYSCRLRGGTFTNDCEDGHGVCCVFSHSCSVTTMERVTYYRNPSFPRNDTGNLVCNYKVDVAPQMCGVRLDFLNYSTPILGKCVDTQLSYFIGKDTRTTPICGILKGMSATIPVTSSEGPIVISHVLGGNVPYLFNIRITQIRCNSVTDVVQSVCGRRNTGRVRHKRIARQSGVAAHHKTTDDSGNRPEGEFTINSIESSSPWNNFPYNYLKKFEVADTFLTNAALTRIIAGSEAVVNEWPWQAAILKRKNLTSRALTFYCGGVLITENFIVTAAHCVSGFKSFNYTDIRNHIVVSLGDHDLRTLEDAKPVFRGVKKVIMHHQWEQHRNVHDIALLQLSRPVNYTGAVMPACLPEAYRSMADKELFISGWGVTSFNGSRPGRVSPVLKTVAVTGVATDECDKRWKVMDSKRTVWPEFLPVDERRQVCVGTQPGAACFGDSGGPATYQDPDTGRFTLAGVTSFGPPVCTVGGLPTIYTRISYYLDWIRLSLVQLFKSEVEGVSE